MAELEYSKEKTEKILKQVILNFVTFINGLGLQALDL
jgi:hypothetical protein